MKYSFEQKAMNNEPMPDNLTAHEACVYTFLRNLYWSLAKGMISKEQAQREKDITLRRLDAQTQAREFERRCWENSAKRTLAVDHAMMMYHADRTLENADRLHERLEWLADETALEVKLHEHGANCPICNKFFNQDHANRKPVFCEDCGCRLGWDIKNGT